MALTARNTHQRNNEKVNPRLQKRSIIQRAHARRLRRLDGGIALKIQRHKQPAQVHAPCQQADQRHQDIIDERINNAGKRSADHYPGSQFQNIAFSAEAPEFFQKIFH